MSRGGDIGDKPVPEPAKLDRRKKDLAIKGDRWGARCARRIILDGGAPVDYFGFGNGEIDLPGMANDPYGAEGSLEGS